VLRSPCEEDAPLALVEPHQNAGPFGVLGGHSPHPGVLGDGRQELHGHDRPRPARCSLTRLRALRPPHGASLAADGLMNVCLFRVETPKATYSRTRSAGTFDRPDVQCRFRDGDPQGRRPHPLRHRLLPPGGRRRHQRLRHHRRARPHPDLTSQPCAGARARAHRSRPPGRVTRPSKPASLTFGSVGRPKRPETAV
jgi:hypothetical protein